MRILYTDEIDPATLPASDKLYFYNGHGLPDLPRGF